MRQLKNKRELQKPEQDASVGKRREKKKTISCEAGKGCVNTKEKKKSWPQITEREKKSSLGRLLECEEGRKR